MILRFCGLLRLLVMAPEEVMAFMAAAPNFLSLCRLPPRQLSFSSPIRKHHPSNVPPASQIPYPLPSVINTVSPVALGGAVCHVCAT